MLSLGGGNVHVPRFRGVYRAHKGGCKRRERPTGGRPGSSAEEPVRWTGMRHSVCHGAVRLLVIFRGRTLSVLPLGRLAGRSNGDSPRLT